MVSVAMRVCQAVVTHFAVSCPATFARVLLSPSLVLLLFLWAVGVVDVFLTSHCLLMG